MWLYVVRANYKARNLSLPFVHHWEAGTPRGDGDQGRAWPVSAGPLREQFQWRSKRWDRAAPGSLPAERNSLEYDRGAPGSLPAERNSLEYAAQFPDLRLVWEWGYTCSFNLQSELTCPPRGSKLAE